MEFEDGVFKLNQAEVQDTGLPAEFTMGETGAVCDALNEQIKELRQRTISEGLIPFSGYSTMAGLTHARALRITRLRESVLDEYQTQVDFRSGLASIEELLGKQPPQEES